ncbi:glycoside hydrolase family 3 protein [Maricaulis parjimensis]|uniref:glycoside hydrolase family 3 protein n=1 Tax=Maricaulis parjimensis TaxID=144023 RepID=UPI0019399993|nr:glycoside hydrolase family 3 N-terminal domain-containing protein [Maricaulis parjimensis]
MKILHAFSLVGLVSVLVSACGTETDNASAPVTPDAGETVSAVNPEVWPAITSPFAEDADLEARVADLLSRMTLEEKVGQVIQADIASVTPEEVREYNLGSVLNGGNSAPGNDNYGPPSGWVELADAFWEASTDRSDGGVGIPVMWGTDAVHGHNNIGTATIFPHNIGLGAANNPDLIRQIGEVTAREIRVTGQEWTFAPTLAVVRDDRWGRTYESYSEDPAIVAAYATAMMEGLQGEVGDADFLQGSHVLATAKHFIGDGGTHRGVDQGDNRSSEEDLARIHGGGYPPAIEAGALSVMASFNSWHGEKLHGHEGLLTDVLVDRLGFTGFVVGDWNGHGQIEGCTATSCAQAFNAGVDMYMAPDSWRDLYASLLEQVQTGEVSMERLDEAVSRILRVKIRMGLLDEVRPSERPLTGQFDLLGSPEHRAVARQAVRESLVLLQNRNAVLPIASSARVLVAGEAADSIGQQSGGWTINWQGEGNENSDFGDGSSILDGIRDAVEAGGGEVVYQPDGAVDGAFDVAVIVFGEAPYAEFQGDVPHLDFADETGLDLLRSLSARGIPTVAVFLSGRPMWMNPELNAADAFVAAWLPGSEGSGVADVLVGDQSGEPRHDFTGRLSFSWPARPDQSPLNIGDADYQPLFAMGYGGSYANPPADLAMLDESLAVGVSMSGGSTLINSGRAATGYALVLTTPGAGPVDVSGPRTQTRDGVLAAIAEDRFAQEDTKRFEWNGGGAVRLELASEGVRDLSAPGLAFNIVYAVPVAPEGDVAFVMECGETCEGRLDVTAPLRVAEGKGWREAAIPLHCFAEAGADLTQITLPFLIETDGPASLSLSDVRIVDAPPGAGCDF